MTREKSDLKEIRKILVPREQFRPFPKYDEREAWESLPEAAKEPYLSAERELLDFESSALTAVKYMSFYRTGMGAPYQQLAGARRETLLKCMLCECMEHRGKFLDKIVDLVWAICEETSWIDPHHNNHMHDHMLTGIIKNPLPDVRDSCFVDLVAGNTSSLLAWVYYFLKEPLDEITPMICERIEYEIHRRIVVPFMTHDDLTWFGFYGHKINNWNPWILSNILCADLICVKDPDLRAKFFSRALDKLDIYIRQIPEDGGCDEGPGYWFAAGATLYDALCVVRAGTGGKLDFFGEPLVRRVGEFIAKAHLFGERFANFADNGPRMQADCRTLCRFGRDTGSDFLLSFALSQPHKDNYVLSFGHIARGLWNLFLGEHLPEPDRPFESGCFWLPKTEVYFGRDLKNEMQLAMKGGFNNESHNHNDLGHFILLWKGEPVFPDLGNLPYTAKTFSPYRYDIWILTSAWHSCASVNGYDQHAGDEFKAQILEYREEGDRVFLSMELRGAYVPEAGIESYVRGFVFDRASQKLTVTDTFLLREATADVESHFVTIAGPKPEEGLVRIPVGEVECLLRYDPASVRAELDSHDLEVAKKGWNAERAWRVVLRPKAAAKEHVLRAEISMKSSSLSSSRNSGWKHARLFTAAERSAMGGAVVGTLLK